MCCFAADRGDRSLVAFRPRESRAHHLVPELEDLERPRNGQLRHARDALALEGVHSTIIAKRSESVGHVRHAPSVLGDWPLGVLGRLWL